MPSPAARPQSFSNHRAHAPWFMLAGVVIAGEFGLRIVHAVQEPQAATIWAAAVGAALVVVWGVSRGKAQRVQDRVIRLEMRLRLERVLPPAQRADIERLSLGQIVALRFASDAELPALVRDVLAGDITKRDDIKRRIKDWQADWLRV